MERKDWPQIARTAYPLDGMPHGVGMKTLIAGSEGMIGSNVARLLQNDDRILADLKLETDLRTSIACDIVMVDIDRVFHLADRTAGIGYAKNHHGQMLTDSLLISLNLLEAARQAGVTDYLYVSSPCLYRHPFQDEPVPEYYADSYIPEIANEGYGWAKRIAEK